MNNQVQEKLDYIKWLSTTGVEMFGIGPVEKELLQTTQYLANILRKDIKR
jgi:hypothetical protein